MSNFRKCVFLAVLSMMQLSAHGQTASWIIRPEYSEIKAMSADLMAVGKDGSWGIMSRSGSVVIPVLYPAINGYAQEYCTVNDKNSVLRYIVDRNGKAYELKEDYKMDESFPYFSNGMLSVRNRKGYAGYLSYDGSQVSDFIYRTAFPFSEGLAVVSDTKGFYYPVNKSFRMLDSFKNQDYRFMSSFAYIQNTLCAVAMINENLFIIDVNGRNIKSLGAYKSYNPDRRIFRTQSYEIEFDGMWRLARIKASKGEESYKYPEIANNIYIAKPGLYGTEKGENGLWNITFYDKEILPSQFFEVKPMADDCIIASTSSGYGLLSIDKKADVMPEIVGADSFVLNHYGDIEMVIDLHRGNEPSVNIKDACLTCDSGEIIKCDVANGKLSVLYRPVDLKEKNRSVLLGFCPIADGIQYPEQQLKFSVSYLPAFTVSSKTSIVLNKDNHADGAEFILVNNADAATAPCNVTVNGKTIRKGLVLAAGQSVSLPLSLSGAVNIEDNDSITLSFDIMVMENNCPSFTDTISIVFKRYFDNN